MPLLVFPLSGLMLSIVFLWYCFSEASRIATLDKKIKLIYNVLSVISTLAILSGAVLFVYGNIKDSNTSDNNLIMEQIKKATKDKKIISVNTADIYGFGNESIIVTASNYKESAKDNYGNNLVILDRMDNEKITKNE